MSCCKVRLDEGLCFPHIEPCSNRTEFEFFDGFHPTQVANVETARVAYYSNSSAIAYPYNISYLAELDSDAAAAAIDIVNPIIDDNVSIGKEKYAAA